MNKYPKQLRVEVLSLGSDGLTIEDVKALTVKLEDGSSLGILPGHAPLIAATGEGPLQYTNNEGKHEVYVKAGIMTVKHNLVSILTTY